MASELKRGIIRIGSNYVRLVSSVVLSLLFFPVLLGVIQDDGVSLVLLFGSTAGLASMFQEFVRRSMIRELGVAHHQHAPDAFRATYHSAILVSIMAAGLAALVFVALWFLIPVFDLGGATGELDGGARALLLTRGIQAVVIILTAPTFNMILIKEHMLSYNFWVLMMERGEAFIAAILLAWLLQPIYNFSIEEGVIWFSWISLGLTIIAVVIPVVMEIVRDPRLRPGVRRAQSTHVKEILKTSGWNGAIITAMNLYMRVDQIIMNLAFGLFGNLIFGFAVLMTGYGRRLTIGMTDGLDAVGARIVSNDETRLGDMLRHAARLHAIVAFPTGCFIAILAEPLLLLWVGPRLQDPAATAPQTAVLIQVLMAGIITRGISDAWIRSMYGAGHIRRYAPFILLGGLLNPGLAVLVIWLLPGEIDWIGAAVASTALLVPIHGIIVPWITARITGVGLWSILSPLLRPLLASIIASSVLVAANAMIEEWRLWHLVAVSVCFGVAYVAVSLLITFNDEDRRIIRRVVRSGKSRLPGKQEPTQV